MHVGILKTDGGPHAAEDWATASADRIMDMIQVDPASPRKAGLEAAKEDFRYAVRKALEPHHGNAQTHERGQIASLGDDRLLASLDASGHLDDPFAAVIGAAKGTLFEAHFAKPEIRDALKAMLAQHFASAMDIERSWHADRLLASDPQHELARAYRGARDTHGAGDAHLHAHKYRKDGTA